MTASDRSAEKDPRWSQVVERAEADFVYAVRSTGIYCRPSCPARRPKPENVAFYAGPDQAEAAGFRACLRCHPRGVATSAANAAMVEAACRRIEAAEGPVALKDLAAEIGLSPFYLHRLYRAHAKRMAESRAGKASARWTCFGQCHHGDPCGGLWRGKSLLCRGRGGAGHDSHAA